MESYKPLLAMLGATAWTLFLLLALGAPSIRSLYPFGLGGQAVSSDILPLFFLTLTSWVALILFFFSFKVLARHHWRAERICSLSALQALFPFLAPLLMLLYIALLSDERVK